MSNSYFSQYRELDSCGVRSNTNKASFWIDHHGNEIHAEGLLTKYEHFLAPVRERGRLSILELGAGIPPYVGASMRCWKSYFGDGSDFHVADLLPEVIELQAEGFHAHQGDLGDVRFLNSLAATAWDFVLDDASHLWHHQVFAFRRLFPSVKSGGIYIVEDLCTSFGDYRPEYGLGLDQRDAAFYFLALSRAVLGGTQLSDRERLDDLYTLTDEDLELARRIDMMSFMTNCCIIVKRG